MKIIIVGDGKVGVTLTAQLSAAGHDVVVIDSNPKVLEQSLEAYDVMVVQGNGASMQVLEQAGIRGADLVIAATSGDEINLLCCIVAKKMAGVHTIARVRSPEYLEQLVFLKEELGLSMTVNPEFRAAREIYHLLKFPSFLKRDRFANGRVEIVEIHIGKDSKLRNISLAKLYDIAKVKVLVCAVERGEEVFIPSGSSVLEEGDNIYVTAPYKDLTDLIKHLGLITHKIKEVMIVGGSRIAHYLASSLIKEGIGVKIIEQDQARCTRLAVELPKATILEGDGSRQDILLAEGLAESDALVALTNMDEENIVIGMYARQQGVRKVITKVNRTEYVDIFRGMGLDTFVSPKLLCATDITRYVRAMENTSGGEVRALHYIADAKVEALEFMAGDTTRYLGVTLAKIPLRPGVLLACITREGRIIIPSGEDTIEKGDSIIVVTKATEESICGLNDIFES